MLSTEREFKISEHFKDSVPLYEAIIFMRRNALNQLLLSRVPGISCTMAEECLESDDPRSTMPAELHHPLSKYPQWKFKLFRVKSMEKAPLPSETLPEKRVLLGLSAPPVPDTLLSNGMAPGSVMKLCLGGKSKENVEGLSMRVDMKLQEMDAHMNKLRYLKGSLNHLIFVSFEELYKFLCLSRCLCRLCGMMLRKFKGPVHDVQGNLDNASRGALRKMGCRLTSWPEVIYKVFKVDVTEDLEAVHPLFFCHRCWMTAIRGGGVCSLSRTRVREWKPHSSLCELCSPRKASFQRTRRKRRKGVPRALSLAKRTRWDNSDGNADGERRNLERPALRNWPKSRDQREQWVRSITHCQRDHFSINLISEKLPEDFLFSFTCVVCDHLLSDPVQPPCGHLSCRSCIKKYNYVLGPHCPVCNLRCTPDNFAPPAKAFLAALQALPLLCPRSGCGREVRLDSFKAHYLDHELEDHDTDKHLPECDNYLLINKGGRPRQHLLSLTRRAQKHRLKDLKSLVKTFADKEEGGDLKSVCLTLFLLALRSANEHRQADELEAIMQGKRLF